MNEVRIGCKRDARKALQGLLEPLMVRGLNGEPRAATGAFRRAYVSRDGKTVYKVQHNCLARDNAVEAKVVAEVRMTPTGRKYVTPITCWMIDGVAVNAAPMAGTRGRDFIVDCHEAIERGEAPFCFGAQCAGHKARDEVLDAATELGIEDMHAGNWAVDASGHPWIIDANISYAENPFTPSYGTADYNGAS